MRKYSILYIIILFIVICSTPQLSAQVDLDIETGIVFSDYNDVRIPGDGGTLFSLSEEKKGISARSSMFSTLV